ncbi:hypothetical protein D3C75_1038190 [compost metagenome]
MQHFSQHIGIHKSDKGLKGHPLQPAELYFGQLLTGDLAQHGTRLRTPAPAGNSLQRIIKGSDIFAIIHQPGRDPVSCNT